MRLLKNRVSDKSVKTRVLSQQIDLLNQNQSFAIFITTSIVLISFLYLSSSIDWVVLRTPFIVFVFAMSLRVFSSYQYFFAKKDKRINLIQAESYYLIGIVATGIFWCISTLTLFPLLDLKGQLLLLVIIIGFATGAQTTMGYLRMPVICFMLLLFLPLIYVIYNSEFPGSNEVVVALSCYILFLLRSSLMFYKNTYEMLLFHEISLDKEAEYIHEKEKANAANLAKSQFLSRMSHELRTPLNAILGFAELQLRDTNYPLPDKQSSRVYKISDAGKHLLSLVNDVLDFSRIETGKMEIKLEVINLYDVILTSMRMFEDRASRRNIKIYAQHNQLNYSIKADNNRFKQVVVNLLDNAIKFNKLGGKVMLYASLTENNRVRLYVEDTGFGLGDGIPNDLFLPFSRLNADSLGIDGTGIGLSLCKELVEIMDGEIGLDSDTSEGCRFWVELPHVANSRLLKDNDTQESKVIDTIDTMKILLVEDNIVNSEVAVDMLDVINVKADVASNGNDAIELFKKNRYPLIFMDCEMPIMDGFETTKEIRRIEQQLCQDEKLKPTTIIALTAHAISGAKEKCLLNGMDDFVSKPFSVDDLHAILHKWIDLDPLSKTQSSIADEWIETRSSEKHQDSDEFDTSILDQETIFKLLKKQTEDGVSFLNKVVTIYLQQSSELMSKLDIANKDKDVEAIRIIAHTLKSSSINTGAIVLSDTCRELELSCEKGVFKDSLVAELYQHFSEAKAELTELIQKTA